MGNFLFPGKYLPFNISKVLFIPTGSDKQCSPGFPVASTGMGKGKGKVFSASLLPTGFGFYHSSSSEGIEGMAQELQRTPRAASQRICVQLRKDPKISPKVCQHISGIRRIPENHPRDPCASPQNPRISPKLFVSIPQRIPEYFPKRSAPQQQRGERGLDFPQDPADLFLPAPPGSLILSRSRVLARGSILHPGERMGAGSTPASTCWGPGSHRPGIHGQTGSPGSGAGHSCVCVILGWPQQRPPTSCCCRSAPGAPRGSLLEFSIPRLRGIHRPSGPASPGTWRGHTVTSCEGIFPLGSELPRLPLCHIQDTSPHFTKQKWRHW